MAVHAHAFGAVALHGSGETDEVEIQRQPVSAQGGSGTPPTDCDRTSPLAWSDFQAASPSSTGNSAAHTSTTLVSVAGGTRLQARFRPLQSWVLTRYTHADRRVYPPVPPAISACHQWFAGMQPGQTGYYEMPTFSGCAALITPPDPYRASSSSDCTTYGTSADTAGAGESARLLAHEQRHYDITCDVAREGNRLIGLGVAFNTVQSRANARLQPLHNQYDTDSSHGCDASGQATWDADHATKVADEFKDLVPPSSTAPTPTTTPTTQEPVGAP